MGSSIFLGLLIIAVGSFCQSSSYVPINKIKGCSGKTIAVLICGLAVLIFSTFLPQLI